MEQEERSNDIDHKMLLQLFRWKFRSYINMLADASVSDAIVDITLDSTVP
jgi:hypothetical protein